MGTNPGSSDTSLDQRSQSLGGLARTHGVAHLPRSLGTGHAGLLPSRSHVTGRMARPNLCAGHRGWDCRATGMLSGTWFGTLALVDSLLLQIFTWSLVTRFATPRGGVHGRVSSARSELSRPYLQRIGSISIGRSSRVCWRRSSPHRSDSISRSSASQGSSPWALRHCSVLSRSLATTHRWSARPFARRVDAQSCRKRSPSPSGSKRISYRFTPINTTHAIPCRAWLINMQTLLRQLELGTLSAPLSPRL